MTSELTAINEGCPSELNDVWDCRKLNQTNGCPGMALLTQDIWQCQNSIEKGIELGGVKKPDHREDALPHYSVPLVICGLTCLATPSD